jgi:exonuclease SbcC
LRFKNGVEVYFPQNQVTLITGENGAGKTSILDALCISLYGKTLRTSGRVTSGYLGICDLVNHESDKASIRVEFENHGHNYVVSRTITKISSDGEFYEDGDKKAVGHKVFDYVRARALGLDWEGFRKSTIVLQGEMSSLTELDPRPRKDAFIKLFGLDRYFGYEELAKKKAESKESEISTFKMANDLLKSDVEKIPTVRSEVRRLKRLVSSLERKKAKLGENLRQKKEKKESLEVDYNRFVELKTKLGSTLDQITKARVALAKTKTELKNLLKMQMEFPKLKKAYEEYTSLEAGQAKLKPVKSKYDAVGQKILTLKNTLGNKRNEHSEVMDDLKDTRNGIKDLRKQIPSEKTVTAATGSLTRARVREKGLNSKADTLRAEIRQAKSSVKDLKSKMGQVEGKAECPVCFQKITNPEQIFEHYNAEIKQLKKQEKGKQNALSSTLKKLQLESKNVQLLAAKEKDLIKKAAKKSELSREKTRFSSLMEKKKRLSTNMRDLRVEIKQKLKEQSQLGFLPSAYSKIDGQLIQLRQKKTAEKFSNAETEIKRLPTVEQTIIDENEHIDGLEKERLTLREQKHKLNRVESTYDNAKRKFDEASKLFNSAETTLAKEDTNKTNQEKQLEELKDKERTLKKNEGKIKQLKLEIITMGELRDIFKNIPENILRRLRPSIEKEGTDIINELSDMEITALNIEEDTLNVAATMNGEVRPIHYFSGGQKTRINMALRVAVARILSKLPQTEEHSFVTMQTLFIDEGDFGNLDEQGIREAISVMRNLTKEFDRVILVSHVDEIREIFHGYTIEAQKTGLQESTIRTFGTVEPDSQSQAIIS